VPHLCEELLLTNIRCPQKTPHNFSLKVKCCTFRVKLEALGFIGIKFTCELYPIICMYRESALIFFPHDTQWVLVESIMGKKGKKVRASSKNGMLAKSKHYNFLKCPISGRV
jgi:hypothetical protein